MSSYNKVNRETKENLVEIVFNITKFLIIYNINAIRHTYTTNMIFRIVAISIAVVLL